MKTAYRTNIEKTVRREQADTIVFKTYVDFLKDHKGWRKGNIHTFLGEASGGKSTLTRTLIVDLISANDKNVLIWLSEESVDEFLVELDRAKFWNIEKLHKTKILSELDENLTDENKIMARINSVIQEEKIDVIFFDNITTSSFYDGKTPSEQSRVTRRLKTMAEHYQIPVIIFAHTNGQLQSGRLIEMNDIRGSKTLVNISQFFYIMQSVFFEINDTPKRFNAMRITKHRGQHIKNSLYRLDYNEENRTFSEIKPVSFSHFSDIYSKRNRL